MELLYKELTEKVIKCIYEVYNVLGVGFLESVYENALMIELKNNKIKAEQQKKINVLYKNNYIGDFKADIVVEDKVIIEIKSVNKIISHHEAQLINYLKSTGIRVGLIVNFSENFEIRRRIF